MLKIEDFRQRNCFYCKTNVTEGYHLRLSFSAEKSLLKKRNLQSSGVNHQVFICSECSKEYLGIKVIDRSNTVIELKLLAQQILPAKRIKKWNPSRRYK